MYWLCLLHFLVIQFWSALSFGFVMIDCILFSFHHVLKGYRGIWKSVLLECLISCFLRIGLWYFRCELRFVFSIYFVYYWCNRFCKFCMWLCIFLLFGCIFCSKGILLRFSSLFYYFNCRACLQKLLNWLIP